MNINRSSNIIYGGVDGIITTSAILAGSIATNQPINIISALTLSSLFADGFSMAVSAYESEVIDEDDAIYKSVTTFMAFIIIGSLPILTYIFVHKQKYGKYITIIVVLLSLFLIGMFKIIVTKQKNNYDYNDIVYYGFNTMFLGTIAGIISYYVSEYVLFWNSNTINPNK